MKKSFLKLFLFTSLVFAFAVSVSTLRVQASDTEVTGVLSTNIAGGWGEGIAVEFTPGLALGTYWEAIDTSKLVLKNAKGVVVPITLAETVGDQIAINRGSGFNYYGYTLTIQSGFQVIRTSDSHAFPPIVVTEKTYVFRGNVTTGGYWDLYTPATDITVDDNTLELTVGGATHQVVSTLTPETANPIVLFESADAGIASVSSSGLVTAVAEGSTTITIYAGSVTEVINVSVSPAAAEQTGILITTPEKKITTFKGYEYDLSKLTAVVSYDGGGTGAAIIITPEKISGTFDKDTIGNYTLTLTDGAFSDTFTVEVVAVPAIAARGTTAGSDFGNNSGWGNFYVVFDSPDISQYLNIKEEALAQVQSKVSVFGEYTHITSIKNLGGGRYEFWFDNANFKAGDKIVLEAGMGLWQYAGGLVDGNHDASGGEFVLIGELKADLAYVYTGSAWAVFVADPTAMELSVSANELLVEGTLPITFTLSPENSYGTPTFASSNTDVATVSATGVVTGVAAGNVTITVTLGSIVETVELTVSEPVTPPNGILITTPEKTITTFAGYPYDLASLTAVETYEGGGTGAAIVITSDMVTGTYDANTPGNYTLTLTSGTFTDTFTVVVEAVPAIDAAGTVPGNHFGNNSGWGAFYVVFNSPDIAEYLNLKDEALTQVMSKVNVAGRYDLISSMKNLGGGRYEFWFVPEFSFKAGDVIVLEEGMGLWQYEGGTFTGHDASGGEFVLIGELKADLSYVYTGTDWAIFTAEPTDFSLSAPVSFVAAGATLDLTYAVTPEGTYGTPIFSTSDADVATVSPLGVVTGVAEGTVVITAILGDVTKTIEITVTAALDVVDIEILDVFNIYYVVKDAEAFTPVFTRARLVFEGGSHSPEFTLTPEDYSVGTIDTSVVGNVNVTITVTYEAEDYDVVIPAKVYEYVPQRVSEVGIVDWFIFATFIQMPNTSGNEANITNASSMPDTLDHITYERADGTEIELQGFYMLGTNLVLFPVFLYDGGTPIVTIDNYDEYYLEGDMITLSAGLPIYRWTGGMVATETDNHAMDPGTGEVVIDGYIEETIQYRYNGNVWGIYIEYTDVAKQNDAISMLIGENKTTGVTRVPANATTGTFTYESSDETIVSVTENGILQGLKAGTATITITLSDSTRPNDTKTTTVTVTVSDYITGLSITGPVDLTQGKTLDLTKLEAKYLYRSGALGDAVDLTDATITGLNAEELGEQTIIISLVSGTDTFSGELVVNVVKSKVGLYIGIGGGVAAVVAGAAALIFVFVIKKKPV